MNQPSARTKHDLRQSIRAMELAAQFLKGNQADEELKAAIIESLEKAVKQLENYYGSLPST